MTIYDWCKYDKQERSKPVCQRNKGTVKWAGVKFILTYFKRTACPCRICGNDGSNHSILMTFGCFFCLANLKDLEHGPILCLLVKCSNRQFCCPGSNRIMEWRGWPSRILPYDCSEELNFYFVFGCTFLFHPKGTGQQLWENFHLYGDLTITVCNS